MFWRSIGSALELHDRREGGYTLQIQRLCPGARLEDAGLGAEAMLCASAMLRGACTALAPRRAH